MQKIKIVLIEPSHPGNIGAVARAMANMGLTQLSLVSPRADPLSQEALARAGHANALLKNAQRVASFKEAIESVELLFGASARKPDLPLPVFTPKLAAEKICGVRGCVAIVFGTERDGLSAEDLQLCDYQIQIPADPGYPILNLSQAVQIICYELFQVQFNNTQVNRNPENHPLATVFERSQFLMHLKKVLIEIQFLDPDNPKKTFPRFERLFSRLEMTQQEVNMLRGFLTRIEKK